MTTTDTRVTVRNLPWYGTSTALADEEMTSEQALELSGLNWEVDTKPLYFRVRQDGKDKQVKASKSVVYRKDTFDELGIVGGRYETFQNREAFAFLDKLVENEEAVFQAAGSMNGGSRVFVVMRVPETTKIMGDEHDTYILFMTSHDGSLAVTATTTLVRLACTNMFRAAMTADRPVFKASHITTHVSEDALLVAARNALGVTKKDQERFEKMANRLSEISLPADIDGEFEAIMKQAMPWESKATVKEIVGIHDLWINSDTIDDDWRFTGWGLANATTEYLSHFRSRRSDEAVLKRALGVNTQIENRLAKALLNRQTDTVTKTFVTA